MKKALSLIACAVILIVLMVLPGFVLYIVGDIVNTLIPDKKAREASGEQARTAGRGV